MSLVEQGTLASAACPDDASVSEPATAITSSGGTTVVVVRPVVADAVEPRGGAVGEDHVVGQHQCGQLGAEVDGVLEVGGCIDALG